MLQEVSSVLRSCFGIQRFSGNEVNITITDGFLLHNISMYLQEILRVSSVAVVSDSVTPWTAAHQASLSITNSWSLLKQIGRAHV